jgi:hypothetical protein
VTYEADIEGDGFISWKAFCGCALILVEEAVGVFEGLRVTTEIVAFLDIGFSVRTAFGAGNVAFRSVLNTDLISFELFYGDLNSASFLTYCFYRRRSFRLS